MIDRVEGKQILVVGDKVEEVERGVRAGEQGWRVCGGGARETAMETASKQREKCGSRSHGSWETGDSGYRYSGRCGYGGVAERRDDGPWKTPCWRRVSVTDFPNPAPPRHAQQ
jgi:hypothetical protein